MLSSPCSASWALLSLNPSPGHAWYTAGRKGLTHTTASSVCKQDGSVFWTEIASACSIIWEKKLQARNVTDAQSSRLHPRRQRIARAPPSYQQHPRLCLLSATAECRLRSDCQKDNEPTVVITNSWNNRLLLLPVVKKYIITASKCSSRFREQPWF